MNIITAHVLGQWVVIGGRGHQRERCIAWDFISSVPPASREQARTQQAGHTGGLLACLLAPAIAQLRTPARAQISNISGGTGELAEASADGRETTGTLHTDQIGALDLQFTVNLTNFGHCCRAL